MEKKNNINNINLKREYPITKELTRPIKMKVSYDYPFVSRFNPTEEKLFHVNRILKTDTSYPSDIDQAVAIIRSSRKLLPFNFSNEYQQIGIHPDQPLLNSTDLHREYEEMLQKLPCAKFLSLSRLKQLVPYENFSEIVLKIINRDSI